MRSSVCMYVLYLVIIVKQHQLGGPQSSSITPEKVEITVCFVCSGCCPCNIVYRTVLYCTHVAEHLVRVLRPAAVVTARDGPWTGRADHPSSISMGRAAVLSAQQQNMR